MNSLESLSPSLSSIIHSFKFGVFVRWGCPQSSPWHHTLILFSKHGCKYKLRFFLSPSNYNPCIFFFFWKPWWSWWPLNKGNMNQATKVTRGMTILGVRSGNCVSLSSNNKTTLWRSQQLVPKNFLYQTIMWICSLRRHLFRFGNGAS